MSNAAWRDTTFGQLYDLRVGDLRSQCEAFTRMAVSVPNTSDTTLQTQYEQIKQLIEELNQIKSNGGLVPLRKKLSEH